MRKTIILLAALCATFFTSCGSKEETVTKSEYERVLAENNDLRELMAGELKSKCDTESVDHKLKVKQYNKYVDSLNHVQDSVLVILENKHKQLQAAFDKKMDDVDVQAFIKEQESRTLAVKTLQKEDSVLFQKYAYTAFYFDKVGTTYSAEYASYASKPEKALQHFFSSLVTADSIRKVSNKDIEQKKASYAAPFKVAYETAKTSGEGEIARLSEMKKAALGL